MQFRRFVRPHYFTGKLLTAEDLLREQEYHLGKARLTNRLLHGWGVVTGLRVSCEPGGIVVSPGVALDCAGNVLVLPHEERVSLTGLSGRHFVVVRYVEVPVDPIPTGDGQVRPSCFEESVVVEVRSSNPQAGHAPACCDVDHGLCLAGILQRGSRWRVSSTRGRR